MPYSLHDSDKAATGLSAASFVLLPQLSSPGLPEGLLNHTSAPSLLLVTLAPMAFRTKAELLCRTHRPPAPLSSPLLRVPESKPASSTAPGDAQSHLDQSSCRAHSHTCSSCHPSLGKVPGFPDLAQAQNLEVILSLISLLLLCSTISKSCQFSLQNRSISEGLREPGWKLAGAWMGRQVWGQKPACQAVCVLALGQHVASAQAGPTPLGRLRTSLQGNPA